MGIWSSIHEFYKRWKPEIDLYGVGFLLLGSALITGKWAAACVIFVGMFIMDAMRRWGEPWRQIGEKEMAERRRASQEFWQDKFSTLAARFQKEPPPDPPPAPPPAQTRLIARPGQADEEPPESPAPIVETENPPEPFRPPVTHDT